MRTWPARRWVAALIGAVATTVLIAVPTDMINTPVFGRSLPVTWWAWPVLVVTAVLSGLVMATYVAAPGAGNRRPGGDRASRMGITGGLLSWFAVGCPACNKIALVALGASGAVTWFAPFQPVLAIGSVILLGWALRRRLTGERSCALPTRPQPAPAEQTPARPQALPAPTAAGDRD